MTEYNKSLKDDSVKFEIIRLDKEGFNSEEIGRDLGMPSRSVRHFLTRSTFPEFWEKYEELVEEPSWDDLEIHSSGSSVENLMGATDLLDLAMKLKEAASLKNVIEVPDGLKTAEDFIGWVRSNDCSLDKKLSSVAENALQEDMWDMYITDESSPEIRKKDSGEDTPLKILVIADTQCKPGEDLSYMSWIGKYIYDKKPDVVVHIGDNYDCPSLSSYDKGKKSFEGRRLKADLEAGTKGLELLVAQFKKEDYNPRMVFCCGNHEARIDRLANDMPELEGFVGVDLLPIASMGWEVYPFLKPVEINGIFFVHFLANPMTGKPYGGSALNQLKTVGRSFVVGHKQCLDVAIRNTLDGKQQIGIINGACYPFEEDYKGFQGNSHFRGITMLHEVEEGSAVPMFVSLDYLKKRYEEK